MDRSRSKILPFGKKGVAQSPPSASIIDVSASLGARTKALAEPNLRVAVSKIIANGTYRETRHSAYDRDYRNITDDDIQAMLQGPWKLIGEPEWSDEHGNWKYVLAGQDIEGDPLTLVVAVNDEELMITIITKY